MDRSLRTQAPNTSSTSNPSDELFNSLLRDGETLRNKNPELFKTLVAHLHQLLPREPSPVRRAAGAEQKGVKGGAEVRRTSQTFHKYNLPGDMGNKEYYQCMTCSERRATNSFHADHHHKDRYVVRWYCPMCDTLYAVTHRGYHIKNRHKCDGKKGTRRSASPVTNTDDDEENEEDYSPVKKRSHSEENSADGGDYPAAEQVLTDFRKEKRTVAVAMPTDPVTVAPPAPGPVTVAVVPDGSVLLPTGGLASVSQRDLASISQRDLTSLSQREITLPVVDNTVTSTLSSSTIAPPPPRDTSPEPSGTLGRSMTSEALNVGSFINSESFSLPTGVPDSRGFPMSNGRLVTDDKSGPFMFTPNKGSMSRPPQPPP